MNSDRVGRRLAAVLGGAALIAMGAVIAACGNTGNQAPPASTTTTTTTPTTTPPPSTAPASPTEKSISPSGGNLFTPPVRATPAPNIPGGQHPGINGIP
jgi:hypothetical protein